MATEQKFADDKYVHEMVSKYLAGEGITGTIDINKKIVELGQVAPQSEAKRNAWQKAYIVLKSQGKLGDGALDLRAPVNRKSEAEKEAEKAKKAQSYSVPMSAAESNIAKQVTAQINAQRSVSDGTSIVKIIKARPDLADVLPDTKNTTFVFNPNKAADKYAAMKAEENYVTPETKANFDTLVDAVLSNKPIKAVTSSVSNAWCGLMIKKPDGTSPILDRDGLIKFLVYDAAGYINGSDVTRPGLKLKRASSKNNDNGKQAEGVKTSLSLTNMKVVRENPDSYYVTARDVDKSKEPTELRSARSELSYSVFVYKDGKQEMKKGTTEPKVRVKRVSGQVACYPTKNSASYWTEAFAKKGAAKKSAGKTATGVTNDDLNLFINLKAKQILSDKTAADTPRIDGSSVDPDIVAKLGNYNYDLGGNSDDKI